MKKFLIAAAMLAVSSAAMAQVSINIGQPGFYGRIVVGDAPPPRVVYRDPIIVQRGPHYMNQAPIYLRVPAGHQRNWKRDCRRYSACGQRVYFVQDTWYRNDYAPYYQRHHAPRPPVHHGRPQPHRDDHRNDHRNDHRGDHRDDHRGKGRDDHRGNDHRGNGRN